MSAPPWSSAVTRWSTSVQLNWSSASLQLTRTGSPACGDEASWSGSRRSAWDRKTTVVGLKRVDRVCGRSDGRVPELLIELTAFASAVRYCAAGRR